MTAPQAHQASSISGLAAGFASPVHDAQRCFKTVMQAMARPGSLQAFQPELKDLPAPLTPMAAALALTLLTDHHLGVLRVLSYQLHLSVDFLVGLVFIAAPFLFGFAGLDAIYYWVLGATVLAVVGLHKPEPEMAS